MKHDRPDFPRRLQTGVRGRGDGQAGGGLDRRQQPRRRDRPRQWRLRVRLFVRAGQREPAELPDGTPLGNVRADKGTAAAWKVTDAGKFRAAAELVATYADEADADRCAQVVARISAVLAAARAVVAAKDAGSPPPAIVVLLVENLRDALAAADAP